MFETGYGKDMSDPLKLSKLRYESSLYIAFEIWRVWLVLDGVRAYTDILFFFFFFKKKKNSNLY
jgi:hypothetical protein